MNCRKIKLGITLATLFAGCVFFSSGCGSDKKDEEEESTKGRNGLSGLTSKPKKDPKPIAPPPDHPVIEPVEVNLRTLITGKSSLLISPDQVEATLDEGGRNPQDLIAAQAVLGDYQYLREAVEREPDNPDVLFWVLAKNVYPNEREAWIEKFKASDPDNSMGNYLAAQEAFRAQDVEKGMEELRIAAEKGYSDPSVDLRDQVVDFYGKTGQFDREMIVHGSANVNSTPHVNQIQALSSQLLSEHRRLVLAEDTVAADEVLQLANEMLRTVETQSTAGSARAKTMMLFMQEQLAEAAGDPDGSLEQLRTERERIGNLSVRMQQIFAREDVVADHQLESYAIAVGEMGEVQAMQWFVEEIGELPPLEEE